MRYTIVLLLLVGGLVAFAGCGGGSSSPTPPPAATGEALFKANGCATCHGATGEGTAAGPSIVHHTVDQVLAQVRMPSGVMPAFDVAAISDDDLRLIADYIVGLEGEDGHDEPDHGADHAH